MPLVFIRYPKDAGKLLEPSSKMGGGALAADGACCVGKSKYLIARHILFARLSFLLFFWLALSGYGPWKLNLSYSCKGIVKSSLLNKLL